MLEEEARSMEAAFARMPPGPAGLGPAPGSPAGSAAWPVDVRPPPGARIDGILPPHQSLASLGHDQPLAHPPTRLVEPAAQVIQRAADGVNATPGSAQGTEPMLEELTGRLYERISNRLRRELLVDRERAGLLIDPRGR
jgi:hypothetical protein